MKRLNQDGDVVTPVFIAILIVCFVVTTTSLVRLITDTRRFDRWSQACAAHGGYLSHPTRISSSEEWYDCIVDGKTYVVPGYESEEVDRPASLPRS